MCNPRRIIVSVSRKIRENWAKSLEEYEGRTDTIEVQDCLSTEVQLDEEMGDLALVSLQKLLEGGFREWKKSGDDYVRTIRGVRVVFSPATRRLRLSAALAEVLEVAVHEKKIVAQDFNVSKSTSLDLGYFGFDAEVGIEDAEQALDAQARSQIEKEKARLLERGEAQLRAEVRAKLQQRWGELSREKRRELSDKLMRHMAEVQPEVEKEVNLLLAECYRQTLEAVAQQYGGAVTKSEETGSVVTLEIEI